MNPHQFAYAIHGLGLTYSELIALHYAVDTPENCLERVKTELLAQGFHHGITCMHRACTRWSGRAVFIKHQDESADLFEFNLPTVYHHQVGTDDVPASEERPRLCVGASLYWCERVFILHGGALVDCRDSKQLIKLLR